MGFRSRDIQRGDIVVRGELGRIDRRAPGWIVWHAFATGAFCALFFAACGRSQDAPTDATPLPEKGASKSSDILIFPVEMRIKDDSANRFLARAMAVCAEGRYEPFRLLWSVKETPLSRGDFQKGWQAVERIQIRAFQEVFLAKGGGEDPPEGETVYVVLADVHLDPNQRAGKREPDREVALMLVREKGEWRLAKTPAKMRKWIKDRVAAAGKAAAKVDEESSRVDPGKQKNQPSPQVPGP